MYEVEVKLRLTDLAALQAALVREGAVDEGAMQQVDVYFEHPSRDLRARDEALRLRQVGAAFELTYKGPRQKGDAKVRIEHNHAVDGDPTALLRALGFERRATVKKRRHGWRLGRVRVVVDEVDGLGRFIEIEAVGDDVAGSTRWVEEAVERLGLSGAPRVQDSYAELQSDL